MFCPRCSQEQASEEIRFCSRCGLPLGLVSEVVSRGGFLPPGLVAAAAAAFDRKKKKFLTRRMGMKIGVAWFLVLTFVFTPLFGVLDEDDAAV